MLLSVPKRHNRSVLKTKQIEKQNGVVSNSQLTPRLGNRGSCERQLCDSLSGNLTHSEGAMETRGGSEWHSVFAEKGHDCLYDGWWGGGITLSEWTTTADSAGRLAYEHMIRTGWPSTPAPGGTENCISMETHQLQPREEMEAWRDPLCSRLSYLLLLS